MTDRHRYPKSSCCVPFCRRTSTLFRHEWLCGEHWRLVDRSLRAFYRKQIRKLHRAWEKADALVVAADIHLRANMLPDGRFLIEDIDRGCRAFQAKLDTANRYWLADGLIWRRIKRQAIERAMGISA